MVFGWGRYPPLFRFELALLTLSLRLGESQDAHEQVYGGEDGGYNNQAKFSHELIAGAGAFEGFKLFEDHQRKEGMQFESFRHDCMADAASRQASLPCLCQGALSWVFPILSLSGQIVLNSCSFVGGEVDKLAETKGTWI